MLFLPWRGHAAKNSEMPYQGKTCYKRSFMQSLLNVNNQFSFLFLVVLIALLGRLYSGFQHSHWRVTETGAESSRVNEKMVCELNNHLWQLICCLRVGGRWKGGRRRGGKHIHSNCTFNKVSCQIPSPASSRDICAAVCGYFFRRWYFPAPFYHVMECNCLSG